ncbi:MAG TPA: hypothetical protein VFS08_17115 [Gemmatimonadaceae bacterium]|nr:hypothetical protein [Gemmatimonadaceae bacterium]
MAVDLHERLEDRRQLGHGNAASGVVHQDAHAAHPALAPERHVAAGVGELAGVGEQVHQDLLQPLPVGVCTERGIARPVAVGEPACRHLRGDQRLHPGQRLVHRQVGERELHTPGLEAGEVQRVVDEAEQVLAAALDAPDVVLLRRRERAAQPHLQQVGVADDRVERRAELVAHRRQELRLGPVRLLGLGARRFGVRQQLLALAVQRTDGARAGQHDRHEHADDRDDEERDAVHALHHGALAQVHPHPAEGHRHDDRGGEDAPQEDAARVGPRDERDDTLVRPHEGDGLGQEEEADGRRQRHAAARVHDVEEGGAVGVADEGQEADEQRDDRERLGRPDATDGPRAGEEEGQAAAEKAEGRVERHPADGAPRVPGHGVGEEQPVEPEVDVGDALGQRQPAEQCAGGREREARPPAPGRRGLVPGEQEHGERPRDEAEGRVGQHGDPGRPAGAEGRDGHAPADELGEADRQHDRGAAAGKEREGRQRAPVSRRHAPMGARGGSHTSVTGAATCRLWPPWRKALAATSRPALLDTAARLRSS